MTRIHNTDVDVFPLCLGGNVFDWTADERQSFDVLDAYAASGGNFIDTADVYSAWVTGHSGGESERMVGRWMAARGTRSRMVIATKVGMAPGFKGLSARTIRAAAGAGAYLDERGLRLLAVLDDIAAAHHTTVAAVSLAWLIAQPTVVAAIASARSVQQLAELLPVANISLSPGEIARLSNA